MYSYIYDCFLNTGKYEKFLSTLENFVTDLGIKGRICRLSLLNNIKGTIEDEIRRGATTIVIVGNDKTITQAIDVLVPKNVTLGLIPVGKNNEIADLLGIPEGEEACKILSSRIIKNINLGKINDFFFIREIKILETNKDSLIECDNCIIKNLENKQTITVFNQPNHFDDNNAYLITEIKTEKNNFFFNFWKNKTIKSVLPTNYLSISDPNHNIAIIIDGQKTVKTPAIIQKSPISLKVIVGKNRKI